MSQGVLARAAADDRQEEEEPPPEPKPSRWWQRRTEQRNRPFATFINGVTKYIATSTPLDQDWANATALDGGLVEFVRDLKQSSGNSGSRSVDA